VATASDNAAEGLVGKPAVNPNVLKAKYAAERDKRIRADGEDQFVEAGGEHARYLDDPYVEPGFTRFPLVDEVQVVVIGGGFGGMLAAARLRQAGFQDIRIIEKGGDFGGTWYWNRYPGAACDVESYVYLPLLEEVGYVPVEKYSKAAEIRAHTQAIARTFDLYRDVCFQTQVTGLQWDEDQQRWIVRTDRDDEIRTRFVVMANGPLNRPKLPGIPGLGTFQGHSFHTSRWDYGYTGGDADGGLTGLANKRVGIIGTGATAVQCVPYLGASARHLYVFQRTPSSIDVRANQPTDPHWAAGLEQGWQQNRMDNFNLLTSGRYQPIDLVNDRWTDVIRDVMQTAAQAHADGQDLPPLPALMELADFRKMEQIRTRVDEVVTDPLVAEALKPYYNIWCKRPCFSDEYLPTFNRPNVTLVDTDGRGVDRITPTGVVAAGQEYELDCLIYATGFEVGTAYTRRSAYDLVGRDGVLLSEKWRDGASTLHGMMTRGFPNVFLLSHTQAGFSINFPHMINEQSKHLAYVLRQVLDQGASTVEVSEAGEQQWVDEILSVAPVRTAFLRECTPSYYNREGKITETDGRNGVFAGGPVGYIERLESWRATNDLPGLVLR
jgi:cation diffusion facilitator CzcD-associated flavoprotein CzcO